MAPSRKLPMTKISSPYHIMKPSATQSSKTTPTNPAIRLSAEPESSPTNTLIATLSNGSDLTGSDTTDMVIDTPSKSETSLQITVQHTSAETASRIANFHLKAILLAGKLDKLATSLLATHPTLTRPLINALHNTLRDSLRTSGTEISGLLPHPPSPAAKSYTTALKSLPQISSTSQQPFPPQLAKYKQGD